MPDASSFWWNWWINAAVALATFLAVLVALFGQAFRAKFFPPKLSLRLLNPDGEKAVARLTWIEGGETRERMEDCRYYHLRVANSRRWSPATQVQVMLLQVEEPGPNGSLKIQWTGAIPLGWRHQQLYPASRTIGAPADVDLCSVVKNKWVAIHPLVTPFNLEVQRRQASTFVLVLQAQSGEADSPTIRVKIAWDGKWHDGAQEMRGHLSVEVLNETAP
ncbi:MAG TPA: hypothetical protein VNN13_07995 [Methylomirabilota bacterium]|nr:hypothetical protein [Methylomirabilota bacterium]